MGPAPASAAAASLKSTWPRFSMTKSLAAGVAFTFLILAVVLAFGSVYHMASRHGLEVFWESLSSKESLYSLGIPVVLALATAAINGVVGTIVASMLARQRFPGVPLLDSLVDFPLAIPASITGITIMLLYGPLGLIGKGFEVAGTAIPLVLPAVLLAHLFMTLPIVVRAVAPILSEMDGREEEAARILGANELQIFSSVVLPAIRGSLIIGCVFTFARSLGELGATIMVSSYLAAGTQPGPQFMFADLNESNIAANNSMAALLIVVSLCLFGGSRLINAILERKGATYGKPGGIEKP